MADSLSDRKGPHFHGRSKGHRKNNSYTTPSPTTVIPHPSNYPLYSTPSRKSAHPPGSRRFTPKGSWDSTPPPPPPPPAPMLPPWAEAVYEGPSALDREIYDFVRYMELDEAERKTREKMESRIEGVVKGVWPDAELKVFGSWASGLCLPSSDVDFTVCGVDSDSAGTLAKALEENSFTAQTIPNTKVPIVKVSDKVTELQGDISFNIRHASASVSTLLGLLDEHPKARPLIIVLKSLVRLLNINNPYTGGLSSYALYIMVISFLQLRFREDSNSSPTSTEGTENDGSASSETSGSDTVDPVYEGLGRALLEFLEFYGTEGEFDYSDQCISVTEGGSYRPKSNVDQNRPYLLSLQDPLDPGNDVARGTFRIHDVRSHFTSSAKTLANYLPWVSAYKAQCEKLQRREQLSEPPVFVPPSTQLLALFGCDPRKLGQSPTVQMWNPWTEPHFYDNPFMYMRGPPVRHWPQYQVWPPFPTPMMPSYTAEHSPPPSPPAAKNSTSNSPTDTEPTHKSDFRLEHILRLQKIRK